MFQFLQSVLTLYIQCLDQGSQSQIAPWA